MTQSSDTTTGLDAGLHEIHTPAGVLRYYDTGDGPPLLFLHGSGPGVTGQRNFRGVLPTFSRHFRCLVLEFPGFGVSPDLGGHPMIAAHGAAMSFIDALVARPLRHHRQLDGWQCRN